ncbi:HlyD family efflux transporter periplasmic adaptor subunit [Parashewanella spongiae]|uniref:HlyD family efflux transporter periplasmic adaptor subunit n=1 Tax=Parashewanella spongiae TaxID=342950 RepID=A0A3A6TQN9_9GAMM|nr:efflux RND transporter periplasmic adaptor subunit [Parashewanella spongiae]MCL1079733.1 efflux RND transporter periplasmic adaptor subunit [Parashewanella spongiae]RJY07111.1 HlyD family efflux transporter periplasmic adaptor subunit [Parashewanella spongiae]
MKQITSTSPWKVSNITLAILLSLSLGVSAYATAGNNKHSETHETHEDHADEAPHDAESHDESLQLTEQQMKVAGISVQSLNSDTLNLNKLDIQHMAIANLVVNRNQTAIIDPQLDVRVLERHIVPGQEVKKGSVLLTLDGTEVARAQADYINAAKEWDRVKRLTKSSISESQRQQTEVDAQLKKAILLSINMTPFQIAQLKTSPKLVGSFKLLAPINGRIQQDTSMLGQINKATEPLLQLTDESSLWVEAELTPAQSKDLKIDGKALVRVGENLLAGTIIGRSHELDKITRTEKVLLSINNVEHKLHAGQFAELYFSADQGGDLDGIVVPDAALTRSSDGDWQVFLKDADGFEAIEVEVVESQRGLNLIRSSKLAYARQENADIVVSGAFFLASEQAKSGFDIHAH